MSKDTYLTMYKPLDPDDKGGEEMEMSVYYSLGGANYFDGATSRRGIWLSFYPVRREEGVISRKLPDNRGRRLLLKELTRKNRRTGEEIADMIAAVAVDLHEAAVNQDWPRVNQIAKDAIAYKQAAE